METGMKARQIRLSLGAVASAMVAVSCAPATEAAEAADVQFLKDNYNKYEYRIPMRDGTHLFTAVYVPKDTTEHYPFLVKRTPYTVSPYGEDQFPRWLGPVGSRRFAEEGYIFVYQDVRGRYMSQGVFRNMTPHTPEKDDSTDVDESSDMYDTVDWLLENVHPNNARVGIWGISYPGFYTAASIIDNHPAIKAASPQTAIGDWFVGDDFHHKGAFYLHDAFRFFPGFKSNRPEPTTESGARFQFPTNSAYEFFRDMGPLKNANEQYFNNEVAFWDSMMTHGEYDEFWKSRNIIPHMDNVTTAVMTVAGWFDAEDPYGPIEIYESIESQNPGIQNTLVAGPWYHGGWVRAAGDRLGNVSFQQRTAEYYRENVDIAFFNYHLKDKGESDLPEALVFASGSNEWHRFDSWPPPAATPTSLYLNEHGSITFQPPTAVDGADSYVSDPANPVPYTQEVTTVRTREYMVEDQRFVADRSDVLVYQTEVLTEDITLAGPLTADLFISTTGTDADFVVKIIDVYPDDAPDVEDPYLDVPMGGYQMLVRGEVMRSKFRDSWEDPEPLVPGDVTRITFTAPDIFHTFKSGHRIMIQVQSSWFPLVDMNPQTFVDIYSATEDDFRQATHTIHRSSQHPSHLEARRLHK
jgi:putative CocE/NonD family hydrolase